MFTEVKRAGTNSQISSSSPTQMPQYKITNPSRITSLQATSTMAQSAQAVGDPADLVPWTGEEKYSFITQVMYQTKGYSNNSRVNYSKITMPSRSKAAMEIMWGRMKVEAAFAKRQISNGGTSIPVLTDELAVVLQTFPTLPAEIRVKIYGHVMDDPRILEMYFDFSSCSHSAYYPCHFTRRYDEMSPPKLHGACVTLKWTDKTDEVLSLSSALFHTSQEARIEFLKRHEFYNISRMDDRNYEKPCGSPVALNLSQDIIYFGIGTIFCHWNFDFLPLYGHKLFTEGPVQRLAFDIDWWNRRPGEFMMLLGHDGFKHLKEIIMIAGSERHLDHPRYPTPSFQNASNSFREIITDESLTVSEVEAKMQMEALWRRAEKGDFTGEGWDEWQDDDDNKEIIFRDGKLLKLTFMMLERSFDEDDE